MNSKSDETFDPWLKLEELVEEWIREETYPEVERWKIENSVHHQLEYFDWHVNKEDKIVVEHTLLGVLVGKEGGEKEVIREFKLYIANGKASLLGVLEKAIQEMQRQSVPPGEIQLTENWLKVFWGRHLLGLYVKRGPDCMLLSEKCYGRFIPLEL